MTKKRLRLVFVLRDNEAISRWSAYPICATTPSASESAEPSPETITRT